MRVISLMQEMVLKGEELREQQATLNNIFLKLQIKMEHYVIHEAAKVVDEPFLSSFISMMHNLFIVIVAAAILYFVVQVIISYYCFKQKIK